MNLFKLRLILTGAFMACLLAACSGGGAVSPDLHGAAAPSQPNGGLGGSNLTASYTLLPAGGSYALPLPVGYSGVISLAPNHAPPGAKLNLRVSGPAMNGASSGTTGLADTSSSDPFPIIINVEVPFKITIQVPGFTIHFPNSTDLSGTFDVSFFDPTKPISPPLNPLLLGKAVVSGHTLTFTPQPNCTITLLPFVQYTFSVSRDVSSSYPGGANSVILPVQSGTTQTLASVGPLGATVNYQASPNSGFLDWQTIDGSPVGVPVLIFGDNPIESIVVSSTETLTLNSITVTGVFGQNAFSGQRRTGTPSLTSAAVTGSPPPSPTPGPGTFVPDPNPTIFGPFPATVSGNHTSFTITNPLKLGGNRAWDFSIFTVAVCAPQNPQQTCNTPTSTNVLSTVGTNTFFDVQISDSSGLLSAQYTLTASPPCSVTQENDAAGDVPPGYNDTAFGPNAEFDVFSGPSTGTCTLIAFYNGKQVAKNTINVANGGASVARPFTLRPPVNGANGVGVSGRIRP